MAKTANRGAGALSRFAHFAGISKSKADETPSQDEHDELEDKVETVEDKVDDLEDRVDDVEDEVDDEKADDEEMGDDEPSADKPAERAAFQRGRAAGRKAERARAGAILAHPVAAQNRSLALHLAFEGNLSAAQAVSLMKASAAGASPAPTPARKASALDGRMGGSKPVNVGNGGSASGSDMTTASGVAAHVLAAAKRAGITK